MSEHGAAVAPALTGDPIARAISLTDYVRRSPFAVGGPGAHKEWQHFAILAPGIDLLVNFSSCDDVRPGATPGAELPRVVLLVRERTWDGDVETFASEEARIRGGRIDFALRHNTLAFRDGVFHIAVEAAERPIALELRLEPRTMPAFVQNIHMIEGPPLHWVVVPRLRTTGWLRVAGREHRLDGAPAYHDHNWGHFLWGHDVAWEWGFVLPESERIPWCLTFVRLTNRARTVALEQGLFLWRGERAVGVFRQHDVTFSTDGALLKPPRVFKVPRAMALVAPEAACDVPRSLEVSAAAGRDWVECHAEAEEVAQVLIPSETGLGVTIFNEVTARTRVRGSVGGEEVAFEGRSILEFIRA